MSYFQCEGTFAVGKEAVISGETFTHIAQARRVKVGEMIEVQDSVPRRFEAEVARVEKRELVILPKIELPLPPGPKKEVTLLQAYVSEQKLDFILQKTTELGVAHLVLFPSENSPHGIAGDRLEHKQERWKKILVSSCEQSGRPIPPEITIVPSIGDALKLVRGDLFLLDQEGGVPPKSNAGDTTLAVGPEGGFTDGEKGSLKNTGAAPISMGPYTLRAETAAVVGVGVLVG